MASISSRSLTSVSGSQEEVSRFLADALLAKGISGKAAIDEIAKLVKSHQISSMDTLKSLSVHDWEKSGVALGVARAISDAIWNMKQNEVLQKMSLRRENSTKQEMKQRRL